MEILRIWYSPTIVGWGGNGMAMTWICTGMFLMRFRTSLLFIIVHALNLEQTHYIKIHFMVQYKTQTSNIGVKFKLLSDALLEKFVKLSKLYNKSRWILNLFFYGKKLLCKHGEDIMQRPASQTRKNYWISLISS